MPHRGSPTRFATRSIARPLGGLPGSQAGSQSRVNAGRSSRRQSVQRSSPRFGTQERGSRTDAVANFRRRFGGEPDEPITDPNELPRFITPENTLRRQRLGFDVRNVSADTRGLSRIADRLANFDVGDTALGEGSEFQGFLQSQLRGDLEGGLNREDLVRRLFESQLPGLDRQFDDRAEGIAQRTSALGRTGSGLVDREFAELNNEALRAREGLLGRITAQAAQQAIQDRLGLFGAGQGLAGLEQQRDIAGAQLPLQALQAAGGVEGRAASLGLQAAGQNRATDLARSAFLQQQQAREDMLARQAMQDRADQLRFMERGFQSARDVPFALDRTAGREMAGSRQFGTQAGLTREQIAAARAAEERAGMSPAAVATEAMRFMPRRGDVDITGSRGPIVPRTTTPILRDPRLPSG